MDAPPPPRAPHTPKKRKFDRVDEPPGSAIDGAGVDLINTLPDAVLCTIISLLPTKAGARTQAVCARWRPLWRSAPLNLVADCDLSGQERKRVVYISKILAEHCGPALRLSLPCIRRRYHGRIEGWLRSQALTDLQELHFGYGDDETLSRPPLPPSALRFVPTLRVASFSCCHFPELPSQSLNFPHLRQLSLHRVTISDAAASLNFPCLKQLTMYDVAISGDALNSLLFGCLSLESLLMYLKFAIACLRISSPTLRSISFNAPYTKGLFQELVIEDAPCLERLLPLNPDYGPAIIRVIRAPNLQVLGLLSKGISKLHIGATVFQEMTATSVITTMCAVKVLVIEIVGPNLDAVIGFLKCFPFLERLYVVSLLRMETKNV